ncbi:PolA protein [Candidatus Pantoea carbekii]|uniref:PolA protein n=1 Tax=Candidatus Pantoea carbekii TaxID=1235990 RepID=U3U6T1_9GAMM|nr:PolA protein [Candidatus Pantoea carbekii]
MTTEKNPLILVDGSSYLYRAYYVFSFFTNSLNEPTGAIYGMLNMLKNLLIQHKHCQIVIVFDTVGKTFRKKLFEKYKSNRPRMPDKLQQQIKPLYNIIRAMGISLLEIKGVEADDIIGTLAVQAQKTGRTVLISTIDKDIAQLVTPNIMLMNTRMNTILGPEEVRKKYGVPPSLIIDLLAMIGDKTDNIPGIPGVGQKTAETLIKIFGNIHSIYNNLDKLNTVALRGIKTIISNFEKNRDLAFLSYKLATIKTDIEIKLLDKQLIIQEPNIETLKALFKRYEFKHWLNELNSGKWLQRKKNTHETKFTYF